MTTFTQINSNIKLGVLSPVDFNPPPAQCISNPLLLFSTCTHMIVPTSFTILQLSAPPVVLHAVHSSCPSRCPLTILVQKTDLVTMSLLIKDDPFN